MKVWLYLLINIVLFYLGISGIKWHLFIIYLCFGFEGQNTTQYNWEAKLETVIAQFGKKQKHIAYTYISFVIYYSSCFSFCWSSSKNATNLCFCLGHLDNKRWQCVKHTHYWQRLMTCLSQKCHVHMGVGVGHSLLHIIHNLPRVSLVPPKANYHWNFP